MKEVEEEKRNEEGEGGGEGEGEGEGEKKTAEESPRVFIERELVQVIEQNDGTGADSSEEV